MERKNYIYLVLSALFIASLVTCNLIFKKFFMWQPFENITFMPSNWQNFTFVQSVGLLPYPITFLVTDILSEIYGRKRANQVVWAGFYVSIFVLAIVMVSNAVTAVEYSPVSDRAFHLVFGNVNLAIAASMIAYLTAQFIDIRIFHFWKKLTKGKHLWLRNNGSTMFSQVIDTSAVLGFLCFFEVLEWKLFLPLFINGVLFKVVFALLDTPLFYLAVWFLKEKMNISEAENNGYENSSG